MRIASNLCLLDKNSRPQMMPVVNSLSQRDSEQKQTTLRQRRFNVQSCSRSKSSSVLYNKAGTGDCGRTGSENNDRRRLKPEVDSSADLDNGRRCLPFISCVYKVLCRNLPELLLQVLGERNWVLYDEQIHGKSGWHLLWCNSSIYSSLNPSLPWQYTNFIPNAGVVTRKDRLVRSLRCMKPVFGVVYDFCPLAFLLPNEYVRFAVEFGRRVRAKSSSDQNVWICKPVAMSCGRGITIFRDLHELSYSSAAIVQNYLCNPLLISGYKFDLRIYVCIASFRPLVVYAYHDGLTRFATEPFNLKCLRNNFSHITNSSINKFSPAYDERKGSVGLGCKWTLRQLRHHFRNKETSDWLLWCRVSAIILLTLLCEAPFVDHSTNGFELYGFDVIVDDRLVPWLLEVNRHPSLELDCDADVVVKKPMLHDLIDLVDAENNIGRTKRPTAKAASNRKPMDEGTDAWNFRFCENLPPDKVGGFLRVFPVGDCKWRSPNQTRSVVHRVRNILKGAETVHSSLPFRSGFASDDEDYFGALRDIVGPDSVSSWIPRR